jgi:hypothetical protein
MDRASCDALARPCSKMSRKIWARGGREVDRLTHPSRSWCFSSRLSTASTAAVSVPGISTFSTLSEALSRSLAYGGQRGHWQQHQHQHQQQIVGGLRSSRQRNAHAAPVVVASSPPSHLFSNVHNGPPHGFLGRARPEGDAYGVAAAQREQEVVGWQAVWDGTLTNDANQVAVALCLLAEVGGHDDGSP